MAAVEKYIKKLMEKTFPKQLADLVREMSISSSPANRSDVRSCAYVVRDLLSEIGARAELVETGGHPLVVGKIMNKKGAHSVVNYNHYDVQPITNLLEWDTDAFKLEIKDGRYYGRGTTDNKGPLLTLLHAVHLACQENIDLNYLFLCEGEEEIGSPNFANGIQKVAETIKPDSIIIADVDWLGERDPSIIYGLRGLLYMHFNLKTAEKEAHSGLVGGVARNPIVELSNVVAKCYDPDTGKILIPGFYDNVMEPDKEEIRLWLKSPFNVEDFKRDHGLIKIRSTNRETILRSRWAEPTFEAHGCVGGYMERDGDKTSVPRDAQMLVSMRLVPNQDPDVIFDLVERFVRKLNPDVEVRKSSVARPYLGGFNSPYIEAAVEAFQSSFGYPVSRVRCGGSIGALMDMYDIFGQPEIVATGLSKPSHNMHGPNEYFERSQVEGGIRAFVKYFKTISEMQQ